MSYYRQPPHRFQGPGGTQIGIPGLTPMVKLLMVICGAVWVLQFLLSFSSSLGGMMSAWLGVTPALVLRKGMIWQPFTYIFLHSPIVLSHLLLNMLFLWMFGGELERHWGSRGFLRYFLITGTGAGIVVALAGILSPESAIRVTIGASGAIRRS